MYFHCDMCYFKNTRGRQHNPHKEEDDMMVIIRWDNLDSFWIRDTGNVKGKFTMMMKLRGTSKVGFWLDDWIPR